ncbi:hypothetical protein LINPERHAP2_LOCUS5524 [Linum perenne]
MRSTSSTLSAIGILRRVSGYRRKLKWDSKYSVSLYTQLQVAFRVLQRTTTGDGFEKVGDSAGRSAKPRLRFRKRVRFTVEMHYDGLLTSDDYEFGAVAFCDRVDPDYFSLIELMTMAERVGVQDEYYQFLWAKPGQEIKDGLQTIEGEADILTCLGEDGLNRKHHLLKKQLCGVVPAIGDGFRLEEIGDDGTPIGEAEGGSGLSVIPNPLLLGCSAIPEGTVDQPAPDEPDHNPYHEASNEPPKVGEAAIEDMNPPVHSDQAIHGVDEIEGDEVGVNAGMSNQTNPATEVTEADQIAEGSTRWLEIDEILAEMHNEMQAEADQIPMNDDNNSFSSPSIYSSPSQHDFWDGRYNAYSSEDSDRPVHSRGFSREPTPISSDESDETFMPEGFENASLSTDSSDHSHDSGPHSGPHSGIERHDSNDDCGSGEELDNHSVHPEWVQEDATGGQADAGRMDSLWNEEELLEERGWGSEEDEEVQPDQYMIFNADRDLQHAEIVIGKDFKFKMMKRVHVNYQRLASLDPEALCPNAWVRLRERKQPAAYCYPTFSGNGQYEVREVLRSGVVDLRLSSILRTKPPTPTVERLTSGPKQRKRRLEAGELISRKDKRGRPYSTVGKSGQPQKCTICKKTGHNRRAHGIDQVQMDGGSSSTRPPEQPSREATPSVRNVRSK